MADVKAAIEMVLRQEDATLAGTVTNAPADHGGLTRFGLTAKFHPELVRAGFFTTTAGEALIMAEKAYADEYIPHLQLDKIVSTAVAFALLSFSVVEGAGTAVMLAQRVLQQRGCHVAADGSVGPETLTAINAQPALGFVGALVAAQEAHFTRLATADPSQAKWLKGWINRAGAVVRFAAESLRPQVVH